MHSNTPASSIDISIIVPVYKEASNIQPFLAETEAALHQTKLQYEIIFCLDPSPDETKEVIMQAIQHNPRIKLIVFSRRFGQPAATLAGLALSKGQTSVVIDVDLQDPPHLIPVLYQKLQEGYDVVYAKRKSRKGETLTKRVIAHLGYQLINRLSEVRIPENAGDFRIMSRRVVNEVCKLQETHGFLRGLVAFVGFKQTYIEYDRDERYSGQGKYNRFIGSIKIGLNGLISFGSRPLQVMAVMGTLTAGFSFLLGAWYVFQKLYGFNLTPGLSTTILVVTFFSGVQLLSLGLIGEYIGRIYDEVKRRPMYIIDEVIESSELVEEVRSALGEFVV